MRLAAIRYQVRFAQVEVDQSKGKANIANPFRSEFAFTAARIFFFSFFRPAEDERFFSVEPIGIRLVGRANPERE